MCRCASAQWGFDKGQFDHAAVSYGCQIGSQNNGNGDMVTAKQIWLFVPVDGVTAQGPEPTQASPASYAAAAASPSSEEDEYDENYNGSERKIYGQSAVKDPRFGPNSGPNAPCYHPGSVFLAQCFRKF